MQLLLTTLMGMLLMTGSVYAGPERGRPHSVTMHVGNQGGGSPHIGNLGGSNPHVGNSGGVSHYVGNSGGSSSYAAPEIDAASGASAIALLTGVLLLAGERARSKRTSDKPRTEEA